MLSRFPPAAEEVCFEGLAGVENVAHGCLAGFERRRSELGPGSALPMTGWASEVGVIGCSWRLRRNPGGALAAVA